MLHMPEILTVTLLGQFTLSSGGKQKYKSKSVPIRSWVLQLGHLKWGQTTKENTRVYAQIHTHTHIHQTLWRVCVIASQYKVTMFHLQAVKCDLCCI